jgi:hypothetical protein
MDNIEFNAEIDFQEQEISKNQKNNHVHNHTLDFDVSFSKELGLAGESPEDMFIKEDLIDCEFDNGPP